MKANHNTPSGQPVADAVVVNISKIQNESKSQQQTTGLAEAFGCCQYFKDTK